ncbi:hypothetical protein [Pantoea sp.]|uniref:hypothetical protein n=1 Tax=Pantoea sp. TaxID=69393 RepID=UPI00289BE616|nr:hypothetical protein [Pantoea sp.]
MEHARAQDLAQLNDLLHSGEHKVVVINFELTSDEFFNLVSYWGDRGAKVKKRMADF